MNIAIPLSGFRPHHEARFMVTTGGWPAGLVDFYKGFKVFKDGGFY